MPLCIIRKEMTFHDYSTYFEDSVGYVRMIFAISDTFAGLFATEDVEHVHIFEVESVKKDLEIAAGIVAEDELRIKCREALIDSDANQDAFDLFLSAKNSTNKVYVAVFLNINSDINVDPENADFKGVLSPELKGDAIKWNGDNYNENQTPVREWSATARTFQDVAFDQFSIEELIKGKTIKNEENETVEIIPPINSTWINANTEDGVGWLKKTINGTDYEARYNKLISLQTILEKLRSQLVIGLENTGFTDIVIVFDEVDFDFLCVPTKHVSHQHAHINSFYPQYAPHLICPTTSYDVRVPNNVHTVGYSLINDHENRKELTLFTSNLLDRFYCQWNVFQPSKNEEQISAYQYKDFISFLTALGYGFGMLVQTYQSDDNTIHIKFVNKRNIKQYQSYPIGAVNDSIDTKPSEDNKEKAYCFATNYSVDGVDAYNAEFSEATPTPSFLKNKVNTENAIQLPFSLSRSVKMLKYYTYYYGNIDMWILPHNSSVLRYDGSDWLTIIEAPGIHTGLYMLSPANNNDLIVATPPYHIFSPIARILYYKNGKVYSHNSLSEYVNEQIISALGYYDIERSITVPYLCAFSLSEDGSSPSFRNIELGCEIMLDGISYVVIGIERNYASIETKLRLHASSRFEFEEIPEMEFPDLPEGIVLPEADPPPFALPSENFIAGEDLIAGDIAMVGTDGLIYKAINDVANYGAVVGIIQESADENTVVPIAKTGATLYSLRYSFTPGATLYLRKSDELNISEIFPAPGELEEGEETVVVIGTAIAENALIIQSPYYAIHSEFDA